MYYDRLSKNDQVALIQACESEDIDKARAIIDTIPTHRNQHAFYVACVWGNTHAARFLIEHFNIDIHGDDEYAFRVACVKNQLSFAKWFINTFPETNVSVDNYRVFLESCQLENYDMLFWLCTLNTDIPNGIQCNILIESYLSSEGYVGMFEWFKYMFPDIDFSYDDHAIFVLVCMPSDYYNEYETNIIKYMVQNTQYLQDYYYVYSEKTQYPYLVTREPVLSLNKKAQDADSEIYGGWKHYVLHDMNVYTDAYNDDHETVEQEIKLRTGRPKSARSTLD